MAKMFKVGPPENAGELLALEHLANNLPDAFVVLGGVTVPDKNGSAQIDAIVLGQFGIYVVEVKDWRGKLSGHFNGPWLADKRQMPNPCAQARRCASILRTCIRQHATGLLEDNRAFFAIDIYSMVALVNPIADANGVEIEEDKRFRMCKNLDELVSKIQELPQESKRYLTPIEINRIAELLGVPKGTFDDGSKSVPAQNVAPPAQVIACPSCGTENRLGAKHCRNCGAKL